MFMLEVLICVIYGCRNRHRELRVGSDWPCLLCFQMAAKMGDQPNMNSSSPVLDPSLYGFGGQKRSLDNGGQPSACTHHANITVEQLLQVADLNLYLCFLTKVLALNGSIKFTLKSLTRIQGKVSANGVIEQLVTNGVATNTFPFEAEEAAAVVEKTFMAAVELSWAAWFCWATTRRSHPFIQIMQVGNRGVDFVFWNSWSETKRWSSL